MGKQLVIGLVPRLAYPPMAPPLLLEHRSMMEAANAKILVMFVSISLVEMSTVTHKSDRILMVKQRLIILGTP